MHLRDFRIGWRLLLKQPAYSLVAILGLTIGFAASLLLLAYVRFSLGVNGGVPEASQIYLIKSKLEVGPAFWSEATPWPYLDAARRSGLTLQSTLVQPLPSALKVEQKVTRNVELVAVDPDFAEMFGLRPLSGDLGAALTRPDALALTESLARKLFGRTDVLERSVVIGDRSYQVVALLPDVRADSTLQFSALVGTGTGLWSNEQRTQLRQDWGRTKGGRLFVKLPGTDAAPLERLLQDAADKSPLQKSFPPALLQGLGDKKLFELRLTALPDLYFDRDTANSPGSSPHGDLRAVWGMLAVAALILMLAASNYVNLATVQMVRRQREIALRKLMGASVAHVGRLFIAESVMVTMLATLLGLAVAAALMGPFGELMDRRLDPVFTPLNVAGALGLGLLVGLAAGAYPAWVAWRVRPQQTLAGRGSSETVGSLRLRRALTVLQFATAMALTAATLAIAWQTWFASHADPGFDPQPLLVVEAPGEPGGPALRSLREGLARLPGVQGVAAAQDVLGRPFVGNNDEVSRGDGASVTMPLPAVSTNFFHVLGVQPLAGRLFDPAVDSEDKAAVAVLNAQAVQGLGFDSPQAALGQLLTVGSGAEAMTVRIVGVAPNLRYESLREVQQPMVYLPSAETNVLTLRVAGDLTLAERAAEALLAGAFPEDEVTLRRQAAYYAENYLDDLRLAQLLTLACIIALAVAVFGIYVLSAYNLQRLTRQIVLRRLFGASDGAIARLVGRELLLLLVGSGLIGLPIALLAYQRYLAGFLERAPIGLWPLLAALLLALGVALLSTLRHTLVARRIRPAVALNMA